MRPWRPWFRGLLLGLAVLLLAACSRGGAPPFPAQPTQAEALGKVLNQPVQIAYSEPFGQGRALVLFRSGSHPGLAPTLLEQTGLGQWRMTRVAGGDWVNTPLGPLTFDRAGVGEVEEQVGTVTFSRSEAIILYGTIREPVITWVEVTLDEDDAKPVRATVQNGIWLLKLPVKNEHTRLRLTAGDAGGQLFAVMVGGPPAADPAQVAEYDDRLNGILFRSRYAYPDYGGDSTRFLFLDGNLSIRRTEHRGQTPAQMLARFLAAPPAEGTKVTVLEQGAGPLGGHEAAFVRLSTEGPGENRQNAAVYFVITPDADYEVTCESAQVKNPLPWDVLQLRCEQVLEGLRLGR